jgi:molybdenum cofactor synthesis domain-containing protein
VLLRRINRENKDDLLPKGKPVTQEYTSKTAALLLIGNELLSGKVQDLNFAYLAKQLYASGVSLVRVLVIPDVISLIASEVKALSEAYDYVFTSGGVGTTHDDVTIEGVAAAFGCGVWFVPEIEGVLKEYYGERFTESHRRLALAPEGVELLRNELRWPTLKMRNVFILPGVPEIFRLKFEAIRGLFSAAPFTLAEIFLSCEETKIAKVLWEVSERFPQVQMGSYPRFDEEADHRVKLTLEGKDARLVKEAFAVLEASLEVGDILRTKAPHVPVA